MLALRGSSDWNVGNKLLRQEAAPRGGRAKELISNMLADQRTLMATDANLLASESMWLQRIVIFAATVGVLLGSLIAWVITRLIKESSLRVQEGAQLSDETGSSLSEIVDGVKATVIKISDIATATVEQATQAKQVSEAIQGIAQVTEQSAAASEEMASSSEELGAQATCLIDEVARFKT